MMMINGHDFEVRTDMIEVTSLSRPDPGWRFVDPSGHEHRWHVDGAPADAYRGSGRWDVPTTEIVKEPEEYWEDGESWTPTHRECLLCRAVVVPGTCADDTRVFVPGLKRFMVDGRTVSQEFFERVYAEAIRDDT